MAQEDILTRLLAARQQRRKRIGDVIDPMESAARSDRGAGAVVSGSAQMEPADAGEGIMRLASAAGGRSSGGGTPVRTASMKSGDAAPVKATAQRGGQRPPPPPGYRYQCNGTSCDLVPIGGAVQSSQYNIPTNPGEVVTMIDGVPVGNATASAPAATTVVPQGGGSWQDYGNQALSLAGSYATAPQAGVAVKLSQNALASDALGVEERLGQQGLGIEQQRLDEEKRRYNIEEPEARRRAAANTASIEADTQSTLAAIPAMAAEAALTTAQAQTLGQFTIPGRNDMVMGALQDIATGNLSPLVFAQTMVEMSGREAPESINKAGTKVSGSKPQPPAEGTFETYRRMGFSAQAASLLFSKEAQDKLNRQRNPVEPDGSMVGLPPSVQMALSQSRPGWSVNRTPRQKDMNEIVSGAADVIVNNYSDSMAQPFEKLALQLRSDFYTVLREQNRARWTSGKEQGTEEWRVAEIDADAATDGYYEYVEAKLQDAWTKHHANPALRRSDAAKAGTVSAPSPGEGNPSWLRSR